MVSDPVFDAFYPAAMSASSVDGIKKLLKNGINGCQSSITRCPYYSRTCFSLNQPWLKGYNAQNYALQNCLRFLYLALFG